VSASSSEREKRASSSCSRSSPIMRALIPFFMKSSSWLLVIISSYSWSDLDEFSNFSFEILNAIA
jgi:hypothetical protein